jgi:two-component system, NarL family, response regulator DevR
MSDEGEPIRIFVVDDHMVVHDGVRAMCEREGMIFCGGATTAEAALRGIADDPPDVVLLDLRIGSENGFELCERMRERAPELSILVFSAFGNAELLTQAIRAGANGYVLKDTSTSRLPAIIREFRAAGSYFDPRTVGQILIDSLDPKGSKQLSERELSIIKLIGQGASNYEIANELNISPHTVKFHITSLLRRFDVRRRAELVKVAMDRQLMP